ncbi:MAG: hypothetical protein NVSMB27_11430 [Ktedonobacteraceae bacterium]
MALRDHQVRLLIAKRRFCCLACRRTFTETDSVCGRYKRSTKQFREHLAKQAEKRPIAQIAQEEQVGPRFVQESLERSLEEKLKKEGRSLEETALLPTPRFLQQRSEVLSRVKEEKLLHIHEARL